MYNRMITLMSPVGSDQRATGMENEDRHTHHVEDKSSNDHDPKWNSRPIELDNSNNCDGDQNDRVRYLLTCQSPSSDNGLDIMKCTYRIPDIGVHNQVRMIKMVIHQEVEIRTRPISAQSHS